MNITINTVTYENIAWDGESLTLMTDMTLAEIDAAFSPGQDADIIVTEGTREIAHYYNKGINSVQVIGSDPRTVIVRFDVSRIDPGAEDELRESIEGSDDAIIELADMVAGLLEKEPVYDAYSDRINSLGEGQEFISQGLDALRQDVTSAIQTFAETFNTSQEIVNNLNNWMYLMTRANGILDTINSRLANLEEGSRREEA